MIQLCYELLQYLQSGVLMARDGKGRHVAGRENCRPHKSESRPAVTPVIESKRKQRKSKKRAQRELRRQRSYLSLD